MFLHVSVSDKRSISNKEKDRVKQNLKGKGNPLKAKGLESGNEESLRENENSRKKRQYI